MKREKVIEIQNELADWVRDIATQKFQRELSNIKEEQHRIKRSWDFHRNKDGKHIQEFMQRLSRLERKIDMMEKQEQDEIKIQRLKNEMP